MNITVDSAQVWVHDQDEALKFYTEKLGCEVLEDVTVPEMGNFRWLKVGFPGSGNIGLVLMAIPGPPMVDQSLTDQIADLMGKGFAGTVFFTTDDCRRDYEELLARGVEFVQEPEDTPYGVDCGFRDPSGNSFRLTELRAGWDG
ncbi:glyoxalase [Nocardioides gansuensis]|uniref:Glyoxalase n=1 Tax=Nocardioides gansuensis TaxID=2138300 RepID=A0A2T8FAB8_9ACTN|nr:VOC family protein [Nocardioides gansuensis]PVG82635.1 glyoxalase [Nocardioides gansuensis]